MQSAAHTYDTTAGDGSMGAAGARHGARTFGGEPEDAEQEPRAELASNPCVLRKGAFRGWSMFILTDGIPPLRAARYHVMFKRRVRRSGVGQASHTTGMHRRLGSSTNAGPGSWARRHRGPCRRACRSIAAMAPSI